jgi:hypothetical protein
MEGKISRGGLGIPASGYKNTIDGGCGPENSEKQPDIVNNV